MYWRPCVWGCVRMLSVTRCERLAHKGPLQRTAAHGGHLRWRRRGCALAHRCAAGGWRGRRHLRPSAAARIDRCPSHLQVARCGACRALRAPWGADDEF